MDLFKPVRSTLYLIIKNQIQHNNSLKKEVELKPFAEYQSHKIFKILKQIKTCVQFADT